MPCVNRIFGLVRGFVRLEPAPRAQTAASDNVGYLPDAVSRCKTYLQSDLQRQRRVSGWSWASTRKQPVQTCLFRTTQIIRHPTRFPQPSVPLDITSKFSVGYLPDAVRHCSEIGESVDAPEVLHAGASDSPGPDVARKPLEQPSTAAPDAESEEPEALNVERSMGNHQRAAIQPLPGDPGPESGSSSRRHTSSPYFIGRTPSAFHVMTSATFR